MPRLPQDVLASFRVLYVEDNRDISEEVLFFLEPWVKELYNAANGVEGLEIFERERPDVIVTDIQMPKMNGLEMIRKIRESDSDIPIIITTAFNEIDFLFKALDLHVDGYLLKPLDFREMLARLKKVVEPLALRKMLRESNRELERLNADLDTTLREKSRELETQYRNDPLTGLPNFIALRDALGEGGYSHLLLLDVSNFSVINKQYGKVFADKVLRALGNVLNQEVGERDALFKIESDRYVILMREDASRKVESFCRYLVDLFDARPLRLEEASIRIGFCIGIARADGDAYPQVNAEYALDISKETGSGSYYFYDDSAEGVLRAKEAITWLNTAETMVREGSLVPFVQPVVDLSSGETVKYEVLVRGLHDGEILAPGLFLGSVEHLGLESALTRVVISKSFACFEAGSVAFSINLTKSDLLDDYFIDFLKHKLALHRIEPSRVTFEVLETVTMGEHLHAIIAQLQRLRGLGCRIAIDDFGIDNSNLSRLLQVDFDYLKLDEVFIRELDRDPKKEKVVRAIVNMAHSLDIKVVAEFVENEAIYRAAKACGVDMAQGYYIAKPASCYECIDGEGAVCVEKNGVIECCADGGA